MRKLLTLLLLFTFIGAGLQAQVCVPDTTITETGISPSVLPNAVEGQPYNVCATVNVPADTVVNGFPATINFFRLDSAQGLPAWVSFSCDPLNCQFAPGYSSVTIAGTPPAGSAGSYDLTFYISLSVTIPGLGTLEFPDTIDGFFINVLCTPDTTITETGISPSILPLAVEGQPYDVCATVNVPADTVVNGFPAAINFFRLDSFDGLPSWVSVACNPPNCEFAPGYSCVKISGTPPLGSAGKYDLTFFISLSVTIPGLGTLEFPDTIDGFYINVVEVCTPDTTVTATGISPDTLAPLRENEYYLECATITIPTDTFIPGIPLPATINFFRLDGFQGLPEWIQFACNPADCTFPGGTQSCLKVSGCPPCGSAGRYDVLFFITLNVFVPGIGTLEFPDTVTGYFFDVQPQNYADNIRTDRARLNWQPTTGATGYEIQGNQLGVSPPIMISTGSATSLTATGLDEGKCYYWRVRPTAGAFKGEWSCYDTFYTCAAPTDLTVSNLTNSTATLSWTPGPANTTFTVAGRPNPGGPSSVVTINNGTNTSLNATALLACQEYVWTVFAACEGGGSTSIATPNFFTTTGCPTKGELSMLETIPGNISVGIAPNPATNQARILIAGVENEEDIAVQIYDMTGKLMSEYNLPAAPYMSQLDINTSSFAKGVYQVITTTGSSSNVQKLVIGR